VNIQPVQPGYPSEQVFGQPTHHMEPGIISPSTETGEQIPETGAPADPHFRRLIGTIAAVFSALVIAFFVVSAIASPNGTYEMFAPVLGIAIVIMIAIAIILLYFLPGMVAIIRKHPQTAGILLLNVFAGWSLIGWIAAFIWACITPQPVQPVVMVPPPLPPGTTGVANELQTLANLLERNIITRDEFDTEKRKILAQHT
jgi:hypothetical protein